jgi:hypothetical protein
LSSSGSQLIGQVGQEVSWTGLPLSRELRAREFGADQVTRIYQNKRMATFVGSVDNTHISIHGDEPMLARRQDIAC